MRQGDWKLVRFHGDEYSINRGSSYNSYLIKDKKTVLIDTVWLPYDEEFIENLKKRCGFKADRLRLVVNHVEVGGPQGALPGFSLINEGLIQWVPDEEGLKKCFEFGQAIAKR